MDQRTGVATRLCGLYVEKGMDFAERNDCWRKIESEVVLNLAGFPVFAARMRRPVCGRGILNLIFREGIK